MVNNKLKTPVVVKFCSYGMVATGEWEPAFLVIGDGTLRIYASEEGAKENPRDTIMEIPLDRSHGSSGWKRKTYPQGRRYSSDYYGFYITKESPWFGRMRELKLGSDNPQVLENIIRCVEANTHNTTDAHPSVPYPYLDQAVET